MFGGLESVGIFAIKDVGKISFVSNATGKEKAYIDWANKFDFSAKGETVYAKGNGEDQIPFNKAKKGEGTLDMEITSLQTMAFSNGAVVEKKDVNFYERETFVLSANDGTFNLPKTPLDGKVVVYKLNKDRKTQIGELTTATVSAKVLTCTGGKKGDILVATYISKENTDTFTIKATNELSENCTLYLRCNAKTKAEGAFVPIQITCPNVMTTAENSFSFDSESVSPFSLKLDILGDSVSNMVQWAYVPDAV